MKTVAKNLFALLFVFCSISLYSQSPEELFIQGKDYYNAEKYLKAVKCFEKAAKKGHVEAQLSIGICFYEGKGVNQNYNKAVEWFEMAAGKGNADAQLNLGLCYEKGNGVKQNYNEAAKWYRMAAEQGFTVAQYRLGLLLWARSTKRF